MGVEIEYMIVDEASLAVRPIADQLLSALAGRATSDALVLAGIAASNELALHVVELKVAEPATGLSGVAQRFHAAARRIGALLSATGAHLLPSGMHPLMNPERELALWPHEGREIYAAFHRVFDCRGHGWANLQSVHVNLPFAGDDEFWRLHSAMRVLLPLLPALAASSPVVEGAINGQLDRRLEHYRTNCASVPSLTGLVVPEPVGSPEEYRALLQRLYLDLSPYDPDGVLAEEWVNARGCIPRFDRDTIELRVLDTQECPTADLAVVAAVQAMVQELAAAPRPRLELAATLPTAWLASLFRRVGSEGGSVYLDAPEYLEVLGLPPRRLTVMQALGALCARHARTIPDELWGALKAILDEGCLAQRILRALGSEPDANAIRGVYRQLARCLDDDRLFEPAALVRPRRISAAPCDPA